MSGIISTAIVGLVVLGAAALAIRSLVKDRKEGKSACGCGCSCDCSGCHRPQQ